MDSVYLMLTSNIKMTTDYDQRLVAAIYIHPDLKKMNYIFVYLRLNKLYICSIFV